MLDLPFIYPLLFVLLLLRPMKITRSKWDELDIKQVTKSLNKRADQIIERIDRHRIYHLWVVEPDNRQFLYLSDQPVDLFFVQHSLLFY